MCSLYFIFTLKFLKFQSESMYDINHTAWYQVRYKCTKHDTFHRFNVCLKKKPHTFDSLLFRSLEECLPSSWCRSYFFEAEHLEIILLFPFTIICICLVKRSEHPTDEVLELNPSSCTIPHVPICTILHFTVRENVHFVLKALNSKWSKLRRLR